MKVRLFSCFFFLFLVIRFHKLQGVPFATAVTVLNNTVGDWASSCSFYFVRGETPQCWFEICPGQQYNLSFPFGCEGAVYYDVEIAGYTHGPQGGYSCPTTHTEDFVLGPAEICTYAKLTYSCETSSCYFENRITSRSWTSPIIEWSSQSNGSSGLKFDVSGVNEYHESLTCLVFRNSTLEKLYGCLQTNDESLFAVSSCYDGQYDTSDSQLPYIVPLYGGSYKALLVATYPHNNRVFGNNLYILAESSVLTVRSSGAGSTSLLKIDIYLDIGFAGEPLKGNWSSNFPSSRSDYLQLVEVNTLGM